MKSEYQYEIIGYCECGNIARYCEDENKTVWDFESPFCETCEIKYGPPNIIILEASND